MPNELDLDSSRTVLVVAVIGLAVAGVGMSAWTHDPHWLNRGGAAIAAAGAAAILWQVRVELNIEEGRKQLEAHVEKPDEVEEPGPMEALQIRLANKRIERLNDELTARRLGVVAYVVTCAMIGELLHGFGDLLMCGALSICASH